MSDLVGYEGESVKSIVGPDGEVAFDFGARLCGARVLLVYEKDIQSRMSAQEFVSKMAKVWERICEVPL